MTNRLAENIRVFRKERGLTQEQLAEVLGVTVGAVYKWEAKLSLPELSLIMELADFFDTSVDVLLGYEMKDNRLRATVERLKDYAYRKDRAGLAEAEKALKKYPNAFDVVYHAARMDLLFSVENRDRALLRRGLERYEAARRLLSQNTDPRISESTICGEMAKIRMLLGETEEALALLKRHNAGGVYDDLIGWMLTALQTAGRSAAVSLRRADEERGHAHAHDYGLYERVFSAKGVRFGEGDSELGNRRFRWAQGRKHAVLCGQAERRASGLSGVRKAEVRGLGGCGGSAAPRPRIGGAI